MCYQVINLGVVWSTPQILQIFWLCHSSLFWVECGENQLGLGDLNTDVFSVNMGV